MPESALRIERLVAGGDGLARERSGRVVFVTAAAPGDVVRVAITERRRDFARGEIVEMIEPGPDRVSPPCPHVADGCGGCGWQHLDPDVARHLKASLLAETMQRVGKLSLEVEPGPPLSTSAFRSTVRAVATSDGLGFRRRRSHDPVAIETCMVAHPLVDEVMRHARLSGAPEVTIRAAPSTGGRLAVVHGDAQARLDDAPADLTVVTDADLDQGHRAVLRHVVAGRELRVSAGSFFQTSHDGAEALVDAVRSSIGLVDPAPGTFVDLYGGVGLFGAGAAGEREVVVVESSPSSAADAVRNLHAQLARVEQTSVEDWVPEPAAVVVADPPRAGLGDPGVDQVVATGAELVVLVSCDAASFARDVSKLRARGYSVRRCVSLDLFSRTHHVEVVTTLVRERPAWKGHCGDCQDVDVMSSTTDRPTLDLLDPTFFQADPHEAFTWMRANEPVYRDEKNELWAITRHADVLDVERRAEVFSSRGSYRAIPTEMEENMIAHDDPQHLLQRRLVNRRFTPRAVREQHDEFVELIDELIDGFVGHGRVEVIEGLAAQLPSRLTCRMLGFDEAEWELIKSWSERLMRIDSRERSEEQMMEFLSANMELYQRVLEEHPKLEGCPADHLMAVWANDDNYDIDRMFHEVGLFISGGAETTRTVIAHGLRTFCDHPDQWDAIADDPGLASSAVEEMIRWVTPLNNMFRTATADTEVGGQAIAAGDRLMLVYPSANRDEVVFHDPFTFDIGRSPNPHVAFGHGTHFCLGANLARHELALLLQHLSRRITNLEPVSEPDVEPNVFARAVRSFHLAFDTRH